MTVYATDNPVALETLKIFTIVLPTGLSNKTSKMIKNN